jgi:hypothetical protein
MYFFRTFKKSTAPYKVHNMGLRLLDTPKPPLFKFSVPTYYGDIACFDAHLLGEEKNEFAVR